MMTNGLALKQKIEFSIFKLHYQMYDPQFCIKEECFKLLPVHRFSVVIFTFSGPLGCTTFLRAE